MQKTISLFLLAVFSVCIFAINNSFASPTTPTFFTAVGACCIFAILTIVQHYKQQTISLSLKEVLLGGFLLYAIVYGAINGSVSPVWVVSALSLGLFYMCLKRINLNIEWIYIGLVFIGIAQAIYGLGQYIHWFSNIAAPSTRMSGSFDNPAGFAATLTVCFPFALILLQKKELYWKFIGASSAALFMVAVVLSESRAGIMSIVVISVIWATNTFPFNMLKSWTRRTKIAGSILLIVGLLAGLYFLKQVSANGRLLIWQCSAHMIVDKLLLGHGIGGFHREYMLYQAEYFSNNPHSSFTMLADIVKHPFNEYLLLLVELGLLGGLFVCLFIFYLIRDYRNTKNPIAFYALLCLIGVGVFSIFSYPLGYPFISLMLVFCAALIIQNESISWKIPQWLFSIIKPTVLIVSFALFLMTFKMFYDEYYWNAIAKRSLAGETKAVMPHYAHLYKTMYLNGLFLYNYAAELNYIDRNEESNGMFIEASRFMNDIDLQLQMADNYHKMRKYKEAENCLILASEMIPNRFIPLYRLAKLYEETNQKHKAIRIAKQLLNKSVKVLSPEIMIIKLEMQVLIDKANQRQ